ncbi:MAG: EVE domain-containing protein [Gemmatimonadales bacterium]
MNYWLLKSEPEVYSIDDLKRDRTTGWDSIRNYKARNYLRDEIQVGDQVLFYHSNAEPPGVAGAAQVVEAGHPDPVQFDGKSDYYDPKATREKPIWYQVRVKFVEKFPTFVTLADLKGAAKLTGMMATQRGARLSVQPVSAEHFAIVVRLGRGSA